MSTVQFEKYSGKAVRVGNPGKPSSALLMLIWGEPVCESAQGHPNGPVASDTHSTSLWTRLQHLRKCLPALAWHSFLNIYLFMHFWLPWVFIAAYRLSLRQVGATLELWATDFSLQWLLVLWSMGSRVRGLSSCEAQA